MNRHPIKKLNIAKIVIIFFWTVQEQIADMMLYHPQILCFSKKQGYPTQTSVLPFKPGNHH